VLSHSRFNKLKLSPGSNLKEGVNLALDLSLQVQSANTPFQFIIVTYRDKTPEGWTLPSSFLTTLENELLFFSPIPVKVHTVVLTPAEGLDFSLYSEFCTKTSGNPLLAYFYFYL
jgi:hypothetical protein